MDNEQEQIARTLAGLAHAFTAVPFNRLLGLTLVRLQSDHVAMRFDMRPELIGNFLQEVLHGGVIASVLDMAGGMVVMAQVAVTHGGPIEKLAHVLGKCSTVDLQVNYLRPGRGEHFVANAWLVKSGKQITFTRMELRDGKDKLLATGTGTYLF